MTTTDKKGKDNMAAANDVSGYIAVQASAGVAGVLGRIVWWSLEGDVTRASLVAALAAVQSAAVPPDEPSAVVAVHRAAEAVARGHKGSARQVRRGKWAICNKAVAVDGDANAGTAKLTADVTALAEVTGENLTTEGDAVVASEIRAAFDAAKAALAPTDIGGWLCDKLEGLGAVPLRDRGGVYFLPVDTVAKFDKVNAAIKACSQHKVHVVPAMRSTDAVDAVLSAIESDTLAACEAISEEVREGKLGPRGLGSREAKAAELLARAARYEKLLGVRLDGLRAAVAEVEGAVATARIALASDREEGS